MKKSWALLLLSSLFAAGWTLHATAAVVVLDQGGATLTSQQPIQAVIVDSNGNSFQQTVYYNPSAGGIDLDTSWAGPNASVYFPSLNTGYVWYNGYWVSPEGYYWNGGNRLYVGPTWNNYWTNYWSGRNYWNGDWHHNHWNDNWRGNEWRDNNEWRGDGERRRDNWRDGGDRFDGNRDFNRNRGEGDRGFDRNRAGEGHAGEIRGEEGRRGGGGGRR